MTSLHIAKKGPKAGKYVTCHAQQQCRNGGTHITRTQAEELKKFTGKNMKDLVFEDYLNMLRTKLAGHEATEAPQQPTVETLTADEKDALYASENGLDNKIKVPVSIDFSRNEWKTFVMKIIELDINMPLELIKQGGVASTQGRVKMDNIQLAGKQENISELLIYLKGK